MIIKDFVIIGGGIAGISAIKAIREEDKTTPILWITNEDRIPYKRTKINKSIASGFSKDEFALVNHDWLIDNHIELLFDQVEFIDTEKHELTFKHRGHLRYKKMILATGKSPRPLDINNLPKEKVFHVHTARQTENIIRNTAHSKKVIVIGAGVEGVEVADQLNKLNKEVVLVEKGTLLLPRFFTSRYSEFMKQSIEKSGVKLMLNINEISYSEDESENGILNIGGQDHEFDAIISTIGYIPNIKLALDSNINCTSGILVDQFLKTSAEDIYAAGDVAEHPDGEISNLWHAAEKQGYIAGKNILGFNIENNLLPYRMKTDVFGDFYFSVLPGENDLNLIVEEKGDITRDMYFKNDELVALLMKNDRDRAKMYQQALMEKWDINKMKQQIPL